METLCNVTLGELVNRSISFLFDKCENNQTAAPASVQEDLQRLRHLLLRSGTIVEEADRRHVANRGMLRQLMALRDETFRGHYVLDAVRCRGAAPGAGGGGDAGRRKDGDKEEEEEEEKGASLRRAFALSRFNSAKRVRFPPGGDPDPTAAEFVGGAAARPGELPQIVRRLETMIGDMKEFVVFLASYPTLYRQPYSAHFFVDKCMFGRQKEKERVIEFLLQPDPPGAGNLSILPIVGPALVGKSTLVEHVCDDDRVRSHFSTILFYSGHDLKDETVASFRDNCVVKHKNGEDSGEQRLLILIELSSDDVDEEAWERLRSSSGRTKAQGSKILITSRSEKIARLGTTQALRLKCLPTEAYWYFFKMLAFGSDDPGQHPKLASLAFEMTKLMHGSFMFANIGAILLRANFDTQIWSMVVTRLRQYIEKNITMFGEYPDDIKTTDQPRYSWSLIKQKPDTYFMLYDVHRSGSPRGVVPEVTMLDLLAGCHKPRGKYEILFWRSQIPPYYDYVCTCEIRDM